MLRRLLTDDDPVRNYLELAAFNFQPESSANGMPIKH
jgi:hypothetical protein